MHSKLAFQYSINPWNIIPYWNPVNEDNPQHRDEIETVLDALGTMFKVVVNQLEHIEGIGTGKSLTSDAVISRGKEEFEDTLAPHRDFSARIEYFISTYGIQDITFTHFPGISYTIEVSNKKITRDKEIYSSPYT